MASLANNRELLKRVVPVSQSFEDKSFFRSKRPSEFVFNLYKNGKLHQVVVNESLVFLKENSYFSSFFGPKELYYSISHNENLVGPMLEKALVNLHFDGKYELAQGVLPTNILSSLTNNFFEHFKSTTRCSNEILSIVSKMIIRGVNDKLLMVVRFAKKNWNTV